MSPSQLRWRSCRSKRYAFNTYEQAQEHAEKLGGGLEPYECKFCPKFHVGHPTSNAQLLTMKKRKPKGKRFNGKHGRYAVRAA